jgi:hypothetical protein
MHNYVLRFARDRATIIKMGGTQALWMTGANVAVFPADPTENRRSTMSRGYIYVLINPALQKNFLKIGKTTRTPEERARELSHGTNVPMPYMVAYEHLVADCDAAEARIHNALLPYRASADREFFVLPLHEALKSVMAICIEIGTASDSDTDDGSASPSTVVDAWLKPTEHGLQVAYDACFFPSLELVLSAANVVPSCRIDFGQPPTTLTTYDRKICIQGGTWEQALVRAQRSRRWSERNALIARQKNTVLLIFHLKCIRISGTTQAAGLLLHAACSLDSPLENTIGQSSSDFGRSVRGQD